MVAAVFYTWEKHEYVGVFAGKDWMEARKKASLQSGIPVDDIIPWAYSKNTFRVKERDENPHPPHD
jgi:hypothetical protein